MRDLSELLDLTLRLPINGTTYVVAPPSGTVGFGLALYQDLVNTPEGDRSDTQNELADRINARAEAEPDWLERDTLGDALDRMRDDGVPLGYISHAATTAYVCWTQSRGAAEWYWEQGGKARPPAPDPEPAGDPDPGGSTSTGGASTTPTPASTSGTTSPKKPRTKKAPASQSGN